MGGRVETATTLASNLTGAIQEKHSVTGNLVDRVIVKTKNFENTYKEIKNLGFSETTPGLPGEKSWKSFEHTNINSRRRLKCIPISSNELQISVY